MPNPLEAAKHAGQAVGNFVGGMTAKAAIGMIGRALGEWIRDSGLTPQQIDQAFTEGKAAILLAGMFGGTDPQEIARYRGLYAAMAQAMGPQEYARILDAAAYAVPSVQDHCDVIGRLHWTEYEHTLDDLKRRFLEGRPLVDIQPPEAGGPG